MSSPSEGSAGPPPKVLSTMNQDGSRKLMRPRLYAGRFFQRRRVLAWFLILAFSLIPYITIAGKPAIFLDLAHRQFTFFGKTLLATDTVILMLFMLSILVSIFLLTALIGRVWCGWACPQTVYMEFLFRPIERLFEGPPEQQRKLDQQGGGIRRLAKNGVFLLIAVFLAHTFLAYWVSVDVLLHWMRQSPLDHPGGFLVMAAVSTLVFIDFAWFREQTCLVACPYGRFQSVLLDRSSLIVGYDTTRGESRGTTRDRREQKDTSFGDCIDCGACVKTCPTGIDIRNGLQMECVNCTQCIDACDQVMDKLGKPRGLIRYSSQEELETGTRRFLRPRLLIYPTVLIVALTLLTIKLNSIKTADVTVLRGLSAPWTDLGDDRISNSLRVKVGNRDLEPRKFWISVTEPAEAQLIAPENPIVVPGNGSHTATLFVILNEEAFEHGDVPTHIEVTDSLGFSQSVLYKLLGPRE
ncbi:MAG: cytochrome c oxidase accessory protein CcoG [Candidatus Cloacimonetes bacterium]|nr:cytochrome c oxidase accessory protein CcoG [Candidatus Cloacimonadota bacterium]